MADRWAMEVLSSRFDYFLIFSQVNVGEKIETKVAMRSFFHKAGEIFKISIGIATFSAATAKLVGSGGDLNELDFFKLGFPASKLKASSNW